MLIYEENEIYISKILPKVTHLVSGKTWIKVNGHSHQVASDELF